MMKKAIASMLALGLALSARAFVLFSGDGSDELLHLLSQAYAGPGDEVLYTEHGFVVYPMVAQAVGATPVKAAEVGCRVDVDLLLARVTPRTRIVFVANPNSTGTYISAAEVNRLRSKLPADVLLVLDAAYAEYVEPKDYEPGIAAVRANAGTVMTRTFSKAFGLAGVRLGWAFCPPAIADVLNRLRAPFNVTLPAQAAGVAALDDKAFSSAVRAHNARWRPWLEQELRALGLDPVPSVANFVLVHFADAKTASDANAFLMKRGLVVRQVTSYKLPQALRMTIGSEEANRLVIKALSDFLGKTA